eukprot:CAMPEP_0195152184 /NCGR_PEP_ID=MMETSP0448-20130528/181900_1 /TAXON_ID=66468 /ORGANISM="Heterocapsa triquestra, Strain CCMP 448" /LENGTH=81 /DNA_ID=CAMNT_0040190933 /DNA_START=51 /DNA_END=292 /DNA_ORIENTATION=+
MPSKLQPLASTASRIQQQLMSTRQPRHPRRTLGELLPRPAGPLLPVRVQYVKWAFPEADKAFIDAVIAKRGRMKASPVEST